MGNEGYIEGESLVDITVIAELRGVSKRFGDVLAARDLNLSIGEGAVSYTHLRAHET